MAENREREVTQAFVSLASSMATGYDVVDLLKSLTTECAYLLDVASAGLLLADHMGVLHVMAASSEHTRQLELFQLQRQEGPCLDCYRTGLPIAVADLVVAMNRWPEFVAGAQVAGFASVHALPMRLGPTTLGAVGLFGTTSGALNPEDLSLGQAMADIASVALMQDRAIADTGIINERLQRALNDRVIVEQAKGVVAQCGQLDMTQSLAALRGYSKRHALRLTEVARAVVSRSLPVTSVLEELGRGPGVNDQART